jgi:hypothetical protein
MIVRRAQAVLSSLRNGVDPGLGDDEQSELVSLNLARPVDHDEKRSMESAVREMDSIAGRIRRMTRSFDSMRSGGIHWEAGSDGGRQKGDGREELQSSLGRLEELARQKTTLDSLVFNTRTNHHLLLTLDGRRTLVDLDAWDVRFGELPLVDFLKKMAALKSKMATSVKRASSMVRSFTSPEPGLIVPEIRGPALMMAELGKDPERLVTLMGRTSSSYQDEHMVKNEDKILEATLLASSQGGAEAVLSRFKETRRTLSDRDLLSEDDSVKILSLMNLPPNETDARLERMSWIKANMVIPDSTDVAWLANSRYPLDEVRARYDIIMQYLTGSQFQEDSGLRSASAIMAGSSYPTEVVTERFGHLMGELRGMLESSKVAAAMLASGSLEPSEAIHVFKEAIGVVSRESYFDDAREIENLALLLTRKFGPEAIPIVPSDMGAPLSVKSTRLDEESSETDHRDTSWYYWYYWTHRYYLHRTLFHIRSHPGHMHTVPYFG